MIVISLLEFASFRNEEEVRNQLRYAEKECEQNIVVAKRGSYPQSAKYTNGVSCITVNL